MDIKLSQRDLAFKLHSRFLPNLEIFCPNKDYFNFIHHNCQSLLNKVEIYNSIIINHYDILSLSETWLNNNIPDSLVSINSYNLYRSDRTDNTKDKGGGSALYIKQDLNHEPIYSFSPDKGSEFDAIWVSIKNNNSRNLIVGSIYFPPNCDVGKFLAYLDNTIHHSQFDKADILLLGDFNCNWNHSSIYKHELIKLMSQLNLNMPVIGPTYVSSKFGKESLLDLCFLSNNLITTYTTVLITQISDHYAITGNIKLKKVKVPRKLINCRSYSRNLPLLQTENLSPNQELLDQINSTEDADIQSEILERWILQMVDKHIPSKTIRIRPNAPPWLDHNIKRLISLKNRYYRKIINSDLFENQWSQYKKFRNYVHSQIKLNKKKYLSNQFSKSTSCFFKEINNLLGQKKSTCHKPNEILSNNLIYKDKLEIANILNDYFTSVDSPDSNVLLKSKDNLPSKEFYFQKVEFNEIKKILFKLNPQKRGGIDNIPTIVYQTLSKTVIPALTSIINSSITSMCFPDIYKIALVTPIFKKGDKTLPSNYRPISSLPITSKVIEIVLNTQIINYISTNSLLSKKQFGFRTGISTEHMILTLFEKLITELDRKSPKYIALLSLDVKKAFDTVNHKLLIKKLHYFFRFSQNSIKLLQSYLSNRFQCLKIDSAISSLKPISKGVPQGSILGPLLFNLMINDMLDNHTNTFSYADDTITFTTGTTQTEAMQLATKHFKNINSWYKNNGLNLNLTKTKYMLISNKTTDCSQMLDLEGIMIPHNKNITLLGVIIDDKLSLLDHINNITKQSNSITYTLRKIRHLLNYEEAKLIYTSLIRSRLEYCSSLFINLNKSLTNKIESAQNKAIRVICKAPTLNFSITDARHILNLNTLCSRRLFSFRNLINKILKDKRPGPLYDIIVSNRPHHRTLRSTSKYSIPSTTTNLGQRSFNYLAINFLANRFNSSLSHYIK